MQTNELQARIQVLTGTLVRAAQALSGCASAIYSLPMNEQDLRDMLVELVDADADKSAHFKRYPKSAEDLPIEQATEAREDWTRALRRFDKAVAALISYGKTIACPNTERAPCITPPPPAVVAHTETTQTEHE